MVETQCEVGPVKAYIMSDLLKRFDFDTTSDFVKVVVGIVGFYVGLFYLEYVDTEYSLWLTWFLTPVIVTFLLPAVIIVLIYISSIIWYLFRLYRMRVVDGVQNDWRNAARIAVCALWDAHGWLWHGYEIKGLENIPDGPFLVIYYHGALPIDMYYFTAKMLIFHRRHIHTVADRFMFKIPGWRQLLEGLCVIAGTVQTCAGVLRAGNPLAISPGGVYEAQFGDHSYQLNWKSRIGFAKVAQEAKVPIVPMFTQNVREAFRTVGWLRGICLRIYAATRIPLTPVYGGFPVKLVTHLGPPIPYDPDLTPEQLQKKAARAIEALIAEHQRVPGNILLALIERVCQMPKKKTKSKPDPDHHLSKTDHSVSKIDNPVSKTAHTVSNTDHPVSKADNPVSTTDNLVSKTDYFVSKTDHHESKIDHPVSKTDHIVSKTDNPMSTDHQFSKTDHHASKTDCPVSKTGQTVSKTDHPVSKTMTNGKCHNGSVPNVCLKPESEKAKVS